LSTIYVVGLGAGELKQLPMYIYEKLMNEHRKIFLRTKEHPAAYELRERGVVFDSFDEIYAAEDDFQAVYQRIVDVLVKEAKNESVIYAVPGHPMVAEQTVQGLLAQQEVRVEIVGGQSYLDDLFTALQIDPVEGFQFVDGTSFSREQLTYRDHLIFTQVYDEFVASHVKLTLLEDLPFDYDVYIVEAAGSRDERITMVSLEDLDREVTMSNLTSIYVPPAGGGLLNHTFPALREMIRTLRGPDGCDWDRAQTHESLKRFAIEEVYELLAAIDAEDDEAIVEELGDVLLQVMLHSQIGEDNGYFTVNDVIARLNEKMIHRHPHVFGKKDVHSLKDIEATWEEMKREEKEEDTRSIMSRVEKNLPSLSRAFDLQKEAAKVGFDWSEVDSVWEKLREEITEVEEAISDEDQASIEEEFGDVLFVITNLMRFFNVHPEVALHRTNEKFVNRFKHIEKRLTEKGMSLEEATLEEMDKYWEEAKRKGD